MVAELLFPRASDLLCLSWRFRQATLEFDEIPIDSSEAQSVSGGPTFLKVDPVRAEAHERPLYRRALT